MNLNTNNALRFGHGFIVEIKDSHRNIKAEAMEQTPFSRLGSPFEESIFEGGTPRTRTRDYSSELCKTVLMDVLAQNGHSDTFAYSYSSRDFCGEGLEAFATNNYAVIVCNDDLDGQVSESIRRFTGAPPDAEFEGIRTVGQQKLSNSVSDRQSLGTALAAVKERVTLKQRLIDLDQQREFVAAQLEQLER